MSAELHDQLHSVETLQAHTEPPSAITTVEEFQKVLRKMLSRYPLGMPLAMLKQKLRLLYNLTLDEALLGATSLSDLIKAMGDVCVLERNDTGGRSGTGGIPVGWVGSVHQCGFSLFRAARGRGGGIAGSAPP